MHTFFVCMPSMHRLHVCMPNHEYIVFMHDQNVFIDSMYVCQECIHKEIAILAAWSSRMEEREIIERKKRKVEKKYHMATSMAIYVAIDVVINEAR